VQQAPVAYQDVNGVRQAVDSHFTLDGQGHVRFTLGAYDPTHTLVIDPSYAYSSYLGGVAGDQANAVAFSSLPPTGSNKGTVFVVGQTQSPKFRPADTGLNAINPFVLQNGVGDYPKAAFVIALNPATADPVYLTYLVGNGVNVAKAVAVGAGNQAYVTGYTTSSKGFPVTFGAWQPQYGGGAQNAFLAVLGPDGSEGYCTYLGGGGTDTGNAIALDGNGNVFIGGGSTSANFNGHVPDARFGPTQNQDGFVARLNAQGALTSLLWMGGSGDDRINGLTYTTSGQLYVAEDSYSPDMFQGLPVQTDPFQAHSTATENAFVAKLVYGAGAVPTLPYATYFGGPGNCSAWAIAVDPATGNAYVVGDTVGDPTQAWGTDGHSITPGLLGASDNTVPDAWVAKFDSAGWPSYLVILAGKDGDHAQGVAVIPSHGTTPVHLYVAGWTFSDDNTEGFPTNPDPLHTDNRLQNFDQLPPDGTGGNGEDAFLAELDPSAAPAASSVSVSYIGGLLHDEAYGVAVDTVTTYNAWVVGYTNSSNFRVGNPPGMQSVIGGGSDGFVVSVKP
jgi:hypothetical protein